MVEEVFATSPAIGAWTAESLARHTQTVIQGAFVVAKAGNDADLAREALDHLDRYIRLLFGVGQMEDKQ
jgi:TetR/AcrR family transcriptional repressor of nem operon